MSAVLDDQEIRDRIAAAEQVSGRAGQKVREAVQLMDYACRDLTDLANRIGSDDLPTYNKVVSALFAANDVRSALRSVIG